MDKSELLDRITQIGSCEDEATRRELLTQLSEGCEADYDRFATIEATNTQLKEDNESLRSANMKLFLRVGDSKKPTKDETDDEPPVKREFKNLFNEKGGIK